MKIKISAPATVIDASYGDAQVCEGARLVLLDGAASDECFSDYFMDDPLTKGLLMKGVSGGYLRFQFRADLNELWAETEYDLQESLTDSEINNLRKYTLGQWSDGIGENFGQDHADHTGLYLHVLPDDHQVVVEVS